MLLLILDFLRRIFCFTQKAFLMLEPMIPVDFPVDSAELGATSIGSVAAGERPQIGEDTLVFLACKKGQRNEK